LMANRITHVTLDLTSACNLNCVYCYVSKPGYQSSHIDPVVLDRFLEESSQLGVDSVTLAGDGEVTVYAGWESVADRLTRIGIRYSLLTNLSLSYTPQQIETLARAANLTFSFDTYDPDLHKRIRRNSSLERILDNVARIQEAGVRAGCMPYLTQNCVVSDRNVPNLPELVRQSAQRGIHRVAFLYLINYGMDLGPSVLKVLSLESLTLREKTTALASLKLATEIARDVHIDYFVSDILLNMLNSGGALPDWKVSEVDLPPKLPGPVTRLCVQPWKGLFLRRDGALGPCCLLPDYAGNIRGSAISVLVNGTRMQDMRHALLNGDLDASPIPEVARTCATCPIYPLGPIEELHRLVSGI
jgi:MoaA/NifB/PqqE/SkfB family radical SAM enzyme